MTRTIPQTVLLLLFSLPSAFGQQPASGAAEQPPEVKQFQHIEDTWSIAYVNRDQFGMEALLSPTYVDVSAAGAVETRNQHIADMYQHLNGDILSMEQRVVNVRVLGDVALVEGTYILRHKQGGHTYDERGIFTHVYQHTRANWLCLTSQRTAVVDQPEDKAKNPAKKSNAELPFHIPLVYKGDAPAQPPATPQPPQ
jgi:ketosteroid isomerase-like protein